MGDDDGDGSGGRAVESGEQVDDEETTDAGEADAEEAEEDGDSFTTDFEGLADPDGFGRPYPNAQYPGLLPFLGNPSRSYSGEGPVPPHAPPIRHTSPDDTICLSSPHPDQPNVCDGLGQTRQPPPLPPEDP